MIKGSNRNKRFGRRMAFLVMTIVMIAAYTACGAATEAMDMVVSSSAQTKPQNGYYTDSAAGGLIYESAGDYELKMETAETGKVISADVQQEVILDERKLIKTVDMTVETKEYDTLMAELKNKVSAIGGYIERMDSYNGSKYSGYRNTRSASMTIRIPKDKLDAFVEAVSGISNVVRRSDNVEDVTLSYVDMESRRNALKTELDRLLELLAKAQTINEIITIEDRLSTVRYQLESMESQLRKLDNQVDYSTIYLNINEVQELTPVNAKTPGERIGTGFVDSLRDIKDDMVEFVIWFVVNIPYFVIWSVIIVLTVVITKVFWKKKKAKKEKE